jgi:hypothetical protein
MLGEIEIPDPDDPDDPNSTVSFTSAQLSTLAVVIALLTNYIDIQLKRCADAE